MGGILGAFAGVTVDEYGAAADRFVRETAHPSNGRRFQDCGYQPMVELLRYLEANDFVTFIASGVTATSCARSPTTSTTSHRSG